MCCLWREFVGNFCRLPTHAACVKCQRFFYNSCINVGLFNRILGIILFIYFTKCQLYRFAMGKLIMFGLLSEACFYINTAQSNSSVLFSQVGDSEILWTWKILPWWLSFCKDRLHFQALLFITMTHDRHGVSAGMSVQQLVQVNIKEDIKAPNYVPFAGEPTRGFPLQRASNNTKSVSMSLGHHVFTHHTCNAILFSAFSLKHIRLHTYQGW